MDGTTSWTRRSLTVEGIQVTPQNFDKVAEWCGGTKEKYENERYGRSRYIVIELVKPMGSLTTVTAGVGDWVVTDGSGFKVYRDEAMKKCFEEYHREALLKDDKLREIRRLVLSATMAQHNGDLGHPQSAEAADFLDEVSLKILDIV